MPGRHRVTEDQRVCAGAASVGRDATIVERKRRGTANGVDYHNLAHVERNRDDFSGIEVAIGGDSANPTMVGVVVSICGPLWVRPESERLVALPAPSVMVAELRLTAVAASDAVFCPAATV